MGKPMIGIIGGAGVAASIEFLSRLEQIVTKEGAFRDQQHPELVMYQATQVPSRSMFLEGRGPTFIPGYIEAGKKLKEVGASFAAMACNTAHYAIDEISAGCGLPFVNMIEENFAATLQLAPGAKKIGVLCSDGTRKAGIYEQTAQRLGIKAEILQPDEKQQAEVTLGICNIKKAYHRTKPLDDPERPAKLFADAVMNLTGKGAQVVILGCTEIPIDLPQMAKLPVPIVDSLDALAYACLREFRRRAG